MPITMVSALYNGQYSTASNSQWVYNPSHYGNHAQMVEKDNIMSKAIFFVIGALIGYAICTQVPAVPQNITLIVTAVFGIVPAVVM